MKQKIKQTLMVIVGLLLSSTTLAHDFEVDGIYYDYLDNTAKTVKVTYKGNYYYSYSNEYTGAVSIPSSVTYNSTTYSVTSIGWSAFRECTGLTSVTIPNSITSIGNYAFSGCSGLTEVNITDLSAWCKIDFYSSVSNPLYYAKKLKLNGNEIKDLVIPNDITEIKDYAFLGCTGLTEVTIPNSVISIDWSAFSECTGLTSVTIPNSVTSIGYGAFYYCTGLTSVTIPNSVTSIGSSAFSYCTGLTSVTIPNSITSIGEEAFEYCYGLKTIVSLNPTPPTCASSNSFASYNYSKATLYVPKDSYAKYFIDEVWGKFSNIKKIETTATSISLNKSSLTLDKGATETIKATITPNNTTLSFLYWTSDNPIVATVDQSGKITAISAGTAKITAMAIDGSNVSASCKVIVNGTRIVLSQTEATLPVNDIMTLTYTITNSSNKTATWSTSNANVAPIKVNSDGSVTVVGMSDGVATITATANDGSGASASCVVTVGVGGIEGVEVDDNAIEVARYDIHGRLLSEPTRGINIVKMSDGTTRKEIIK